MTRMTNAMRETVARAITKHAHGAAADNMVAQHAHMANLVLDDQLGSLAGMYHAMPEGWLEKRTAVSIAVGGRRYTLNFSGLSSGDRTLRPYVKVQRTDWRPLPHNMHNEMFHYDVTSILGAQLDKLIDQEVSLKQTVSTAYNTALRTLKQYGTVEAAIKGWPAAEKFLTPHRETSSVRNLPAVVPDTINKLLDLPPEDADETDMHK